ncbi:MAG: carbamoyltransferase HypF [Candidatus Omnitrophica bacterium]|nr:carbamoyltransferase HypF [Candidatus Omnitrophota bacterium]
MRGKISLSGNRQRVGIGIEGRVQGVGFRPAVFRYAVENNLTGFAVNTSGGVYIEVEGESSDIKKFLDSVKYHPPKQSVIKHISLVYSLPLKGEKKGFRIEKSRSAGKITTEVSPDIATCPACLKELFSARDRRHLFPFINCSDCGPRFTITKNLPYDRKNTTMERFMMCPDCYAEYINPLDRRFHAQPDCCFACGPEFQLLEGGKTVAAGIESITNAAKLIKGGKIVAVKGTGGYHLVCNGENAGAVKKVRERKKRGDKPFALMAKDLSVVRKYCILNKAEKEILSSSQTPVVILKKRKACNLPEKIAPFNKYLGFFLPYAPVHHLLFSAGGFEVIIATSANIAGEPIIFRDDDTSLSKLSALADYVLTNNRDIHNGCDDSIVKAIPSGSMQILRKARGYTPDPLPTPLSFKKEVFAAGSQEKNTFSFGRNREIITSQHTGTIDSMESLDFYRDSYAHLKTLFGFRPEVIAYDLHPDYITTQFALETAKKEKLPAIGVQHHHAHIASCMIENQLKNKKVIGIAMDGTGYGEDGDIRGAEIMLADYQGYERLAFLDYTQLPGGEKAITEVWRSGAAFLHRAYGSDFHRLKIPFLEQIDKKRVSAVKEMLENNVNCPPASSMGRLFDAVSAIAGIRNEITYDAQAAIELEMAAGKNHKKPSPYRFGIKPIQIPPHPPFSKGGFKEKLLIDPSPLIREVVTDTEKGVSAGMISYRFHGGVAEIITESCKRIKKERNISVAVLSGGVFQNILLLDMVCGKLKKAGFKVYIHSRLPSNDACISAGQAAIAMHSIK